MSGGDFIAIDWGTTNRRIFVMRADGTVVHTQRDDRGVLAMAQADYPQEIASIRQVHGALPVIAAGMVGSTRGWGDVPYGDCPANAASLAAGTVRIDEDVRIVPGLAQREPGAADVMRGEEMQVIGAIAAGLAPETALFCQPGTHNKWIETEAGEITAFATAMTGEIFALLRQHSVLSEMLGGEVADGRAFREGLARGSGATDLPTSLFRSRAAALLGLREGAATASYVSGLLIGADVGSRGNLAGQEVTLLASGDLAALYSIAITEAGGSVSHCDSNAAFAAGIHAVWKALG